MRPSRLSSLVFSMLLIGVGSAFADKQQELEDYANKPWNLTDLPQIGEVLADVNESEPNDSCPGNAYTLGDTFHGAIEPAGDLDWIGFTCTAGDELTIGTDADDGLPTVDTVIELYADDCVTLLDSDDDGGPGLYSLISNFPLPYTGAYYLKIRGWSASSSTGNYICIGSCITPPPPPDCPVDNYKSFKQDVFVSIPDNDPVGVVVGPITVPAQSAIITDVVVDLQIEHTWVGDLVVSLDRIDSGGTKTVDLINRPGVPETTYGCSGNLDPTDKYWFGTGADLQPLGEFDCPSTIPHQCYAVAVENPDGLVQFRGQLKGADWYLRVSDNALGDVGSILNWSIHLLNEPVVSVERTSWASLKATYRR